MTLLHMSIINKFVVILLFKGMMMETPGLEKTMPSNLVSNGPNERRQLVLDQLSSISDWNSSNPLETLPNNSP